MVVMIDAKVDQSAVEKKLKDLMTKDGFVIADVAAWGKKTLAYPIGAHSEATFLEFSLEAEGKNPQLIGKALKLDESILRTLVLKKEEKKSKKSKSAVQSSH